MVEIIDLHHVTVNLLSSFASQLSYLFPDCLCSLFCTNSLKPEKYYFTKYFDRATADKSYETKVFLKGIFNAFYEELVFAVLIKLPLF